ncbi:TPA: DUF551 domain-containing protein [Escherichia coli]|nr:DUF551 domain-containing protein [Escherichia coli]EFA8772445.1 DUF551 domain-containing protein [Escherichia coli O25:H4]HAX0320921.1 DUF551 domain-containing protein [Escherichia coli CD466]EFH2601654.1 DUF551 domain-containing protein [Escherichia coli]EFN8130863.1 DUF551 domain-containing protein [Escherichia coli]
MTTFTDKELIKEIKERISSLDVRDNIERRAYEIALASLEVEPIGFRCRRNDNLGDWSYVYHREPDDFERKHLVIEGIYAAPPAQVVPEEKPMPNPLSMYAVDAVAAIAEVRGWNACRAAMLQAEPVSNSDELPLDYLQGHKDGLEWAAQLAEANHPQTGDWLYDDPIDLARAIRKGPDMPTVQAGNYPVTPDGWISCSERMPAQDDWILIYSKHGEYMAGQVQGEYVELSDGTLSWLGNALYWMPLPEPPQEVN